jgi:hypothetical protein
MTNDNDFLELRKIVRANGPAVLRKLIYENLTGPIDLEIMQVCVFCGSNGDITKEHILPKWVFESGHKHFFTNDVNQLDQRYINATVPACRRCNSEILNGIERYIQKTLAEVNLVDRWYSDEEWDCVIRWLEIIDYKFQVWDIMTKFRAHKKAGYIPALADFSIAIMRDMSLRAVSTKVRRSLKRIVTKNKRLRSKELIVGRTINKTFHYFHTSGQFMHLELPTYNKGFFIFFEKEHKNEKATLREAKKLIKQVYKQP